MNKRVSIAVIGVSVVVLSFFGFFVWKKQSGLKPDTTTVTSSPTGSKLSDLKTWEDPAGFSFEYDKNIVINKHDEDMENYAHLELTSDSHPGTLFIWAKDTTFLDVAQWLTSQKEYKNSPSLDTTLGNLPAKKISVAEPVKKLIVATVTENIIFSVELFSVGDSFWQPVFDKIVSSFRFDSDTNSGGNTDESGILQEQTFDEEETIQ